MLSLWVNERSNASREAWFTAFGSSCKLHEVDLTQLANGDVVGEWDFVCFNFDFPEMTHLTLIPKTKIRWPSVPILMLTKQCSTELALWALRARVFDLLIKPVTVGEIGRCLDRVTEAVRARHSQSERRPQAVLGPMPTEARYRSQVNRSERIDNALAYIARHYSEPLPESRVATFCQISPSRFCREFKAAVGQAFVEYLTQYRVEQAKRLLQNPAMSIADVAAAVGFSDPSYFTRVFRRIEGVAPSAHRGRLPAIEADLVALEAS